MKKFFKKPDEVFSPVNSQLIRKPVSSVCRKKSSVSELLGDLQASSFQNI